MRVMKKLMPAAVAGAMAALMLTCGIGHASTLNGNSIHVEYVWPSPGSVNSDLGTISVPGTVTFPGYFDVAISDSTVVISGLAYSGTYSGTFNGEYLIDNSVTTFPSFVLGPSTNLPGGYPTFTINGNTLEINFVGKTFTTGDKLVLDFATPLPSTWLMLLSGFVGLGFLAYRGKKNRSAALAAA